MASTNMTSAGQYFPYVGSEADSRSVFDLRISFIVIDTTAFLLWICSRSIQKSTRTWADIVMPLSWILNLALCICGLLEVQYSSGEEGERIQTEETGKLLAIQYYAIPPIYLVSVVLPKLFILEFYLHVFVDRYSRVTCYITGTVIILNCIVNIPVNYFTCKAWAIHIDPQYHGTCIGRKTYSAWSTFANIITDIVMLSLPIPILLKLQQSWRTKFFIPISLLVGTVGLAASIARFVEFYNLELTPQHQTALFTTTIWTIIEPSIYQFTACFITFKPLIHWLAHNNPLSSHLYNQHQYPFERHSRSLEKTLPSSHPTSPLDSEASTRVPSQVGEHFPVSPTLRTSFPHAFSNSRLDGLRGGSRPGSSGFITVSREFHVRHGVNPESLDPETRLSLRECEDAAVPFCATPPLGS